MFLDRFFSFQMIRHSIIVKTFIHYGTDIKSRKTSQWKLFPNYKPFFIFPFSLRLADRIEKLESNLNKYIVIIQYCTYCLYLFITTHVPSRPSQKKL